MTAIIFIIVLGVLIFVHELGHFLVARWCGIRVDAFAIGFGPKIFGWNRKGVEYSVRLLPLGGYVKIFGEDPNEENTKGPDAHRSFVNKKKIIQVAVLVAGVSFNFIFAWILYMGIFMTGMNVDATTYTEITGKQGDNRVMITGVASGSPAEKAGLKIGDYIYNASEPGVVYDLDPGFLFSVEAIRDSINNSEGKTLEVTYIRNGETKMVNVTPIKGLVQDKYAIGISMGVVGGVVKFPFFSAIWEGTKYTGTMIKDVAVGLVSFIGTVFQGKAKMSDVTGPIGIAQYVGDAASMGFSSLLLFTAFISINLGVINLLPIPALDGGRVLFVAIEAIFRRPIPMKAANIVNTVGFALLMLLMVVVTFKDLLRIFK